jgi:hypothetical protein
MLLAFLGRSLRRFLTDCNVAECLAAVIVNLPKYCSAAVKYIATFGDTDAC